MQHRNCVSAIGSSSRNYKYFYVKQIQSVPNTILQKRLHPFQVWLSIGHRSDCNVLNWLPRCNIIAHGANIELGNSNVLNARRTVVDDNSLSMLTCRTFCTCGRHGRSLPPECRLSDLNPDHLVHLALRFRADPRKVSWRVLSEKNLLWLSVLWVRVALSQFRIIKIGGGHEKFFPFVSSKFEKFHIQTSSDGKFGTQNLIQLRW